MLAACSSQRSVLPTPSTPAGAAGALTTSTMPAPRGTTITIGIVVANSGDNAAASSSTDDVAVAWSQWVNGHLGGINGHPVKIAVADSTSQPTTAAAVTRRLVDSDGAIAVLAKDPSSQQAVLDVLAAAGIIPIGATSPTTSPRATLEAAKLSGATHLVAALCAAPRCVDLGTALASLSAAVELPYAGQVLIEPSSPDYADQCVDLITSGADHIELALAPTLARSVAQQCLIEGYEGRFGMASDNVVASQVESLPGLKLGGAIDGFPWWSSAAPVAEFTAAIAAYGAGVDPRNPSATSTWAELELFRQTLQDSAAPPDATLSAADVAAAYNTISGETLNGLFASPLSFTQGALRPQATCSWLFRLDDGVFASLVPSTVGNGEVGDLGSHCWTTG